jgi:SAM-dependent methyltransferase
MSASIRDTVVQQFGRPSGPLGRLVGLVMRMRSSNRERSLRTVALLGLVPDDHVLELGYGPGLAVAHAAELVPRGIVVGLDHSVLMQRQASVLNGAAISTGHVRLLVGSAEQLPPLPGAPFDKVFAVNVFMFWKNPTATLRGLRDVMKPGGVIAITFQSRKRAATSDDTRAGAESIAAAMRDAGFVEVQTEVMKMKPVDAACVLGRSPA